MDADVHLLLVDDNPANLVAISAALEDVDARIVTARSGDEALRALLRTEFAAILMDVQMPGLDGFETAEIIRQRKRASDTPIIFITAINQADAHVARGYALGAVDYIFKPVPPEVLRAKVSVFVDLARKRATIARQADELRRSEALHRQRLDEVSREVSSRLSAAASQLRDPTRSIHETVDEVLGRDGISHETRSALQAIAEAADSIGAVVDSLARRDWDNERRITD